MTPQRIVGLALLVVGIAVLVIGLNASHSVADQLHNTFTGRFTDTTVWYIVGGITSGVVGTVIMLTGTGGRHA